MESSQARWAEIDRELDGLGKGQSELAEALARARTLVATLDVEAELARLGATPRAPAASLGPAPIPVAPAPLDGPLELELDDLEPAPPRDRSTALASPSIPDPSSARLDVGVPPAGGETTADPADDEPDELAELLADDASTSSPAEDERARSPEELDIDVELDPLVDEHGPLGQDDLALAFLFDDDAPPTEVRTLADLAPEALGDLPSERTQRTDGDRFRIGEAVPRRDPSLHGPADDDG